MRYGNDSSISQPVFLYVHTPINMNKLNYKNRWNKEIKIIMNKWAPVRKHNGLCQLTCEMSCCIHYACMHAHAQCVEYTQMHRTSLFCPTTIYCRVVCFHLVYYTSQYVLNMVSARGAYIQAIFRTFRICRLKWRFLLCKNYKYFGSTKHDRIFLYIKADTLEAGSENMKLCRIFVTKCFRCRI